MQQPLLGFVVNQGRNRVPTDVTGHLLWRGGRVGRDKAFSLGKQIPDSVDGVKQQTPNHGCAAAGDDFSRSCFACQPTNFAVHHHRADLNAVFHLGQDELARPCGLLQMCNFKAVFTREMRKQLQKPA